jgi:hypothetical protein
MKRIKLFLIACLSVFTFSCTDLDVKPLDIIGDAHLFANDQTVRIYMARLYSDMYMWALDGRGTEWWGRNTNSFTGESTRWLFSDGQLGSDIAGEWNYSKIRNINYFIQEFPKYAGKYTQEKADAYMGEAYFLRAHQYFTMVRRYGGVPLIDRVLNYPEESVEELTYPRSKEVDVYEFIFADLTKAAELLPPEATAPYGLSEGCITRYAALGFKARAALYAASIAKYGDKYTGTEHEGIVGIPASKAAEYFKLAYDAAKETEKGGYDLHDKNPDKAANFTEIFLGKTVETMFARYWTKNYGTNWDGNNQPTQFYGAYTSQSQTYLDYIESCDDIDGNPLVLNTGDDQNPVYYDNPLDLFAKAEPRLSGSVIFPFAEFKRETVEVRKGIIAKGYTPASDLENNKIFLTASEIDQKYEGMQIVGASGIGLSRQSGITGFFVRKFLDPNHNRDTPSTDGSQIPWLELRYAEMLLTRAEAAIELNTLGDGSLMGDALTQLNRIKARAGSNKRYTAAELASNGINILRRERKMEFYYEDKTYWDMRRWRTADKELQGGQRHVIWPIYVWDEGKYYMKRAEDTRGTYAAYNPIWYYNPIPEDAIQKNAKIIRNPGY